MAAFLAVLANSVWAGVSADNFALEQAAVALIVTGSAG